MTEITNGMVGTIKDLLRTSSVAFTVVFFIGHVLIAMCVVKLMTGASMMEAGAVALVEPAINSVWFFVLHKLYVNYKQKQ